MFMEFELNQREISKLNALETDFQKQIVKITGDYPEPENADEKSAVEIQLMTEYQDRADAIRRKARARSLKYYASHRDELVTALKEEIKSIVAFALSFEKTEDRGKRRADVDIWRKFTISSLASYTKLLDKNAEEIISFIDYAFNNSEQIYSQAKENNEIKRSLPMILNMPTGTIIHNVGEVVKAGKNIFELPQQHKQINHGSQISVKHDGLALGKEGKTLVRVDLPESSGYVKIRIPNDIIDDMRGYSIATKKIMLFLFQEINEQIYHNGVLTRAFIQFPAHKLIDNGLYRTRQSGRVGFKAAMDILTSFEIEGELRYKGGKTVLKVDQLAVMFPTVEYGNRGQYKIYVNQQINWQLIFQAFSILPAYYYELSPRASELLYYIFFIARQHTEDIKKRGHFAISFKAIQKQLYLPDERKTEHPQRDIIYPINEAINEIDKAQRKYFGSEDFLFLSAEYNDKANISEILNEGFLQVYLAGDFAVPFIDFENKKIKALKKAQTKRRKALEAKNTETKK